METHTQNLSGSLRIMRLENQRTRNSVHILAAKGLFRNNLIRKYCVFLVKSTPAFHAKFLGTKDNLVLMLWMRYTRAGRIR